MSLFITFEGIDGCGKSTHLRLLKEYLESLGHSPLMPREPGGTSVGEKIRKLLLEKTEDKMTAETELLLFLASRAQICRELIGPALQENKIVISDRFMDSSVAYQGYARGLSVDLVNDLNAFAVGSVIPDITFLLDLDPQVAAQRIDERDKDSNRLDEEGIEFMQRVRRGFLAIAEKEPERVKVISSMADKETVQNAIRQELRRFLV